jgi:hypothetical protein
MAGETEIDDAQTGVTEDAYAIWRRPKATIVRPTMDDAMDHHINRLAVRTESPIQFSGYAAHDLERSADRIFMVLAL